MNEIYERYGSSGPASWSERPNVRWMRWATTVTRRAARARAQTETFDSNAHPALPSTLPCSPPLSMNTRAAATGLGSTPRVRREVDWASAAARVDRLAAALDAAELAEQTSSAFPPPPPPPAAPFHHSDYTGEEAPTYQLRSTWCTPPRASHHPEEEAEAEPEPEAGSSHRRGASEELPQSSEEEEEEVAAGDAYGVPLSHREEELARRLAEAERTISKLQLAAALNDMKDATASLHSGSSASSSGGGLPSPSSERARLRAERAERERELAMAARAAALARCAQLEEELENAVDTCSLLRDRAEAAEARAGGRSHFPPPPPPPPQPREQVSSQMLSPALRAEICAAVRAAESMSKEARRTRLRGLRLRWHPDKHDVLRELATAVTVVLNAEITELQRRLALGEDELW